MSAPISEPVLRTGNIWHNGHIQACSAVTIVFQKKNWTLATTMDGSGAVPSSIVHRLSSGVEIFNLVEPLTARELEVLRLIAAGHSNREIASMLVISLGTVKKHLNNIFGKLATTSRTQAIARARELHLL